MTAQGVLEVALDVAWVALLLIAVADLRRHPTPVRRAVVLVFASIATYYVATAVGRLVPPAAAVTATIGLVALIALPYLTLRLASSFRPVPAAVMRLAFLAMATFAVLAIVIGAGIDLGLDAAMMLGLGLALIGYFVVVEGTAAVLLWREALDRAGAARVRMAIAALSTGTLSGAVFLIGAGGVAAQGDAATQAGLLLLIQVLTLVAALGYIVAFLPPARLRRVAQQAMGYQFIRDLNDLPTGTPEASVWEALAAAGRQATGATRVEVALERDAGGPVVAIGEAAAGDAVTSVPIRIDEQAIGTLRLWIAGTPLFAEDDIELLGVLAQRAARAADRERILVERERLIHDLRGASAAKSEFVAAMSHELRTPLNAIIGFSELLTMPGPDDEPRDPSVTEFAGHIHSSGLHLLELINEVLDLARVESGRLDLRLSRFDLDSLVAQAIDAMGPLVERKRLRLTMEDGDRLELEADAGRVRQIVFNLLSNAVKFTPEGGSITVTLRAVDGNARLSVRDTGPGISEADQARVFEAFQQVAQDGGTNTGTGLGLALTRQLVEAHGGQVTVDSVLGAGATFTVTLPLAPAPPSHAEPAPDGESDRPLVLIVEDDPAAAELLRVYLHGAGYRTEVAIDGRSGLAAAADHRPAAILLDILLPDLDGWEVLRRLKRDEPTRAIPVIVVSIVDDAPLGLALGAIDYFVKPASREGLLEAIGRLTFTTKVRSRTVTVLVIDADPEAIDRYRTLLEPEGFAVTAARHGADGIRLARSIRPDLILLGLALPDGDAASLLAELKQEAATRDIPIWVATADILDASERARLHGQVLELVERDSEALDALGSWLQRVGARPTGGA